MNEIFEEYLESTVEETTRIVCERHAHLDKSWNMINSEPCDCRTIWRIRQATEGERRLKRTERLKRKKKRLEEELAQINSELHNLLKL